MKKLIVIAGPTAVGKTNLAIQLAQRLNCSIISCDSRQFYKEMSIGTAKPTKEEQEAAPHYLVDSHSIQEPISAAKFEELALKILSELFIKDDYAILVGGSGLYIKAICEGFDDIPDIPDNVRTDLNLEFEQKGLDFLLEELAAKDLHYYNSVDKNNPHRVIRALEVIRGTGNSYSSYRTGQKANRPFHIHKFAINMSREKLYERIDYRMDLMLKEGLLEEAKGLYSYREIQALQTVGYKEIFEFMENQYDWEECVRLLKRNSRRYAKRQLTWLRRDPEFKWLNSELGIDHSLSQIVGELHN